MNNNSAINIFIPGGPCISGEYWDHYLKTSEIQGKRIVLMNHEEQYKPKLRVTFDQVVNDLCSKIFTISAEYPINLIAHSFGAWAALAALSNSQLKQRVRKLVLVSLPTSVTPPAETKKAFDLIYPGEVNSNDDFEIFWAKIFPLYVHKQLAPIELKILLAKVYWEGNQSIELDQPALEKLLASVDAFKNKALIYGAEDKVTPRSLRWEAHTVEGTGHFPMLEDAESFTEVLNASLLDSKN